LRDVAREAGVSLMTASRALSNPQLVSEPTIERVRQAAQVSGYVPNLIAGGLKSKRSKLVAGLVPIISVAQFLPTIRALTEALDAAGYQLILGQTGYDHAREERLVDAMLGRRPDGLVVTGLIRSARAREKLLRQRIPVVETWELGERAIDMAVGFSHVKVGSAVAGYFLTKGWSKVGIATGNDQRAAQRREGFVAVMGRDVPTVTVPAPSNVALGRQALCDLLAKDADLRAIFCSSDLLAQGVLIEAAARGLRVPEDLAVCGFGEADFAAYLRPSLTTVHIDGEKIGAMAAHLILKRCSGSPVEQPIIDVGFEIRERDSTSLRPTPSGSD
jgi:LacI family gluconate utilization system Gnt-I transcriptional repressor